MLANCMHLLAESLAWTNLGEMVWPYLAMLSKGADSRALHRPCGQREFGGTVGPAVRYGVGECLATLARIPDA